MILGCLSGSGRGQAVAGTYRFACCGSASPLDPDLPDGARCGAGPLPLGSGPLMDGTAALVGWRAGTVGQTGVDICVELGRAVFVDRVVVRQSQPAAPSAAGTAAAAAPGDVEAVGHAAATGLSCVEVFAADPGDVAPRLVGRTGCRGPAACPAGPVTVTVAAEAQSLVVRLLSFHRDIRLVGMEIWGGDLADLAVFPVPRLVDDLPGPGLRLDPAAVICCSHAGDSSDARADSAAADARFAAMLLAEELAARFGLALPVVAREDLAPRTVWVGALGSDRGAPPGDALKVPSGPEGYALRTDAGGAVLRAGDRRGLLYGAGALLELLQPEAGGLVAPSRLIRDEPRLPFRGVHLFLPAPDQLDYTRRLIRHLLVPLRVNTLFLELAGGMRFERRPEIAAAWERQNRLAAAGQAPPVPHGAVAGGRCLTQAQVRDLVEYARAHGIEVIPEIQSLSHVQYLTMTYPEIAEGPAADGYPDSYCPQHPLSRRIVFDMIDEVLDLLGPLRYLHMGHDEVYTMAVCPRCAGKPRDELFALDVRAIHAYLRERGVGMMIWADMLQPWQRYAGRHAAAMLPKDIVLLEFVWYFRPWADTEDPLLRHGFQVIFGNCYSSHFTRYAARTSKPGIVGTQVSVWSATSEVEMGRLGKLYDLAYSANAAWSVHCQEELRWTFDRRIAALLAEVRPRLHGTPAMPARPAAPGAAAASAAQPAVPRSQPVDLALWCTAPRRDPGGRYGAYDLDALPTEPLVWRGLRFQFPPGIVLLEAPEARWRQCPSQVVVPLGWRVLRLVFAHVAVGRGQIPDPFGPRPVLGLYEMLNVDGGCERQEVEFGHHVAEWNRRHGQPLEPTFYRHAGYVATYPVDPLWQGKTPAGEDVTVYALEWANPRPERPLASLRLSARSIPGEVALAVVGIAAVLTAD